MPPHYRATKQFLQKSGAKRVRFVPGGKHAKIAFEWRSRELRVPISYSTGDPNAGKQAIKQLKQLMYSKEN